MFYEWLPSTLSLVGECRMAMGRQVAEGPKWSGVKKRAPRFSAFVGLGLDSAGCC